MQRAGLTKISLLACVISGLLSSTSPLSAHASDETGPIGTARIGTSYNSEGLQLAALYGYQWTLYEHDHAAFKDNHSRIQGLVDISPATLTTGLLLTVKPASFFELGVAYKNRLYFPAFSNGAMYTDANASAIKNEFKNAKSYIDGEDLIYDMVDNTKAQLGKREAYGAHLLHAHATLQMKLGSVFMVVMCELTRFWTDLPEQQTNYYEPVIDLLISDSELFWEITAIAGYEHGPVNWVIVSSSLLTMESNERSLLLGPGMMWTISKQWGGLKKPSLLLFSRWYLDHLWRTSSPSIPALGTILRADF